MNVIDKALEQEKSKDQIEPNKEDGMQPDDSDFDISIRKIEFPVKPRGVLAE